LNATSQAVFISYASQDAEAAGHICEALRTAGIEVWFDQSELRGGDAWDQSIREQIQECALFVPIISANAHARTEGYFRFEWKLAVDRSHRMAPDQAFLLPVVIDETQRADKRIPDRFRELQWTRLPEGNVSPVFVDRVQRLLSEERSRVPATAFPLVAGQASSAAPRARQTALSSWRSKLALLVTLGVALIIVGNYVFERLSRIHPEPETVAAAAQVSAPTTPQNSIAVLPFEDLSDQRSQAYLAEGMASELAGVLGRIPGLHVIGTTSSFQFKDKSTDIRSAADQLGASYLVQGSVRRSGDRMRVAAQLLEGRSGEQRWSDTYDRDVSDVFNVQDEIATSLARALQLTVSTDLEMHRSTKSPEAYDLYLEGLHDIDVGSRERVEAAAASFQQALHLDPAFAAAAAEQASTYLLMGVQEWIPVRDTLERSRNAAQLALRLDPKLKAAHAVLAQIDLHGWDWGAAESEVLQAQQLGGRQEWQSAEVAAALAANAGHWAQAVELEKAALTMDPLNSDVYAALAEQVYLRSGRYPEAEAAERRTLQISPNYAAAHYYLGLALMFQGRLNDALAAMQQETSDDGQYEGLALVYHAMRRKAESDAALKRALEREHHSEYWPSGIARAYAFRGELDHAMEWLERAW
jgi:TolB-like protein